MTATTSPPKEGFTLQDICLLCADACIHILIGVHKADKGKAPVTITFQLQDPDGIMPPQAWSCVLDRKNQRLNMGLSMLLVQHVARLKNGGMRIVQQP